MGIYVKEENQPWNHKQIAGNATGDNALDATSENNIKNKVVAAKLGNTDISDIGDGTVTGAVSHVNSDLTLESISMRYSNVYGYKDNNTFIIEFAGTNLGSIGASYATLLVTPVKPKHDMSFILLAGSILIDVFIGSSSGNLQVKSHDGNTHTVSDLSTEIRYLFSR